MGMTVGEQQAYRSVTASLPAIAHSLENQERRHFVTAMVLEPSAAVSWIACNCGVLVRSHFADAITRWDEHRGGSE